MSAGKKSKFMELEMTVGGQKCAESGTQLRK